MNAAELRALLDRLGYTPIQAADAVPCGRGTMYKMLAGTLPVPKPVAASLMRHEKLVRISEAVWAEKGIPMTLLEDRVPARPVGRPRAA